MDGTNAQTGQPISGIDHLRQSIVDILTTPIGTRVMRRDYGSDLYKLVDAPINGQVLMRFYTATAEAISKWEPRFVVSNVSITSATAGTVEIAVTGTYLPDGQEVTIDGIKVA
jgi:phage baseplate assembly protein W